MRKHFLILLLFLTIGAFGQSGTTAEIKNPRAIKAKSSNSPTTLIMSQRDSVKFDTNEVKTVYRNALIIQQSLHGVHLDAILRDKLDSIYQQSVTIFESKLKKKPVKSGKP